MEQAANDYGFLAQAAIFLGAAAVIVPIFNWLKLGSIPGYIAAGVLVGPFGLGLVQSDRGVFDVASLGVVLLLFVIGLELSLKRLLALKADIFGFGAAQMVVTGGVIAALFVAADVMPAAPAVIAGLSMATSATVLAVSYLRERGELHAGYGARVFPVLLAQDLIVIPVLIAIPIIAGGAGEAGGQWTDILRAAGVIAILVVIGRYALNPALRLVASAGSREAFAASALFIVAAVALAVSWAGLSMALGAFLAGVLLAESSYRHQIVTDIEPFRGLLLGLFFISIGMQLDIAAVLQYGHIVLGAAAGLVLIKTVLLYALSRLFGMKNREAIKAGALLSQGGEFAFVVFSLGADAGIFTATQSTLLAAIATISIVMTPLVMAGVNRFLDAEDDQETDGLDRAEALTGHVIVVGFGRMGQIVAQVLGNSGVEVTAIDRNPSHIRNAQLYGYKVYYGDGARLDTLITAGALDARAVILCMDDPASVNAAAAGLRERSPNLLIIAAAHDRMHEIELRPLGPDVIVRETLESSLKMAREALSRMGYADALIEDFLEQFRARDRERLLAQMDYGPEAAKELLQKKYERPAE